MFASYDKAAVLLITFRCAPEHCAVQIDVQGDPAQALLQSYYDRLAALKALRVSAEVRTSVRRELVRTLCTAPEMKAFRDTGATLRYRYVDRNGTLLGTIDTRASDCVRHPN